MLAFEILIDQWELVMTLIGSFLFGALVGVIFLAINKDKAVKFGVKLDKLRRPAAKIIFNFLKKPWGVFKRMFHPLFHANV